MQVGESLEGAFQVVKLLSKRPSQWDQCVVNARLKFEKYFKRKVTSILLKIHLICFMYICWKPHNIICMWLHATHFVLMQALQLLHSFPLDTRLKDGSTFSQTIVYYSIYQNNCICIKTVQFFLISFILGLFWQSPKRPPAPFNFDLKDSLWVCSNVTG